MPNLKHALCPGEDVLYTDNVFLPFGYYLPLKKGVILI